MSNCGHFDECSGATCITCHRPLNLTPAAAADAGCGITENMISRMITRYKELELSDDVPDVNDPVTRRFCLELLSAALTPEVRHA